MSAAFNLTAPVHPLFGWASGSGSVREGAGFEVLGIPSDAGNGLTAGARFAPETIRQACLKKAMPHIAGLDHGDISSLQSYDWQTVLEFIEQFVGNIAGRKSRPFLLGGDHSISYAAVAALSKKGPVNVVWFDAHTDFREWEDDLPWHDHGQVLRRINGLSNVNKIVQIGHRGFTNVDEKVASSKMTVFTAVKAADMSLKALLECLPTNEPVYMSVDIDVLDTREAPGTGHPVPGGLSVARVCELARTIVTNRNVVGFDLTEVNPVLDHEDITSRAAARIISELVSTSQPQ